MCALIKPKGERRRQHKGSKVPNLIFEFDSGINEKGNGGRSIMGLRSLWVARLPEGQHIGGSSMGFQIEGSRMGDW